MTGADTHSQRPRPRFTCSRRQDLARGTLDAEERVTWSGPPPPPVLLRNLPDAMESVHFAAVERAVAGLIKCRVTQDSVRCLLLNSWPALTMAIPRTVVEPGRVLRSRSITGGGLARRTADRGSITFGWEMIPDSPGEQALWVRVEGYPSRFLPAQGRGGPLRRAVAAVYGAYHGRVTRSYLVRMASALASGLEAPR